MLLDLFRSLIHYYFKLFECIKFGFTLLLYKMFKCQRKNQTTPNGTITNVCGDFIPLIPCQVTLISIRFINGSVCHLVVAPLWV